MTATNHALTGAVIGLAVRQPLLALPIAFLSHFVLDALPHFGSKHLRPSQHRFVYYLAAEAGACAAVVLTLAILHPTGWFVATLCAFLATSPDFMWVGEFLAARKGQKQPPRRHPLVRFHSVIQWYQKEPGALVELGWGSVMVLVLAKLIVIW